MNSILNIFLDLDFPSRSRKSGKEKTTGRPIQPQPESNRGAQKVVYSVEPNWIFIGEKKRKDYWTLITENSVCSKSDNCNSLEVSLECWAGPPQLWCNNVASLEWNFSLIHLMFLEYQENLLWWSVTWHGLLLHSAQPPLGVMSEVQKQKWKFGGGHCGQYSSLVMSVMLLQKEGTWRSCSR